MISYCRSCGTYTTHLSGKFMCGHESPTSDERNAGVSVPTPAPDRPAEPTAARTVTVYASVRVPLHAGHKRCRVGDAKCTMLRTIAPFDQCRFDDVQIIRTVDDGVVIVWPHRGCRV